MISNSELFFEQREREHHAMEAGARRAFQQRKETELDKRITTNKTKPPCTNFSPPPSKP